MAVLKKMVIMFLMVLGFTIIISADDSFTCCMGGWKSISDISVCNAPCCSGYEEKMSQPPLFAKPLVYCAITPQEKNRKRRHWKNVDDAKKFFINSSRWRNLSRFQ
ncbi:uncharacterized protein LOC111087425 [Limulus polyphemus]|uniref:Uncharacterized protein LOC111087425 n=1 Tax=Limulus polyphemus TaxID=6850 RepID=A0ABM1T1H5_LIMPO|nr:uncharacterized protein LOC111087425 [Limulus polyphemus]